MFSSKLNYYYLSIVLISVLLFSASVSAKEMRVVKLVAFNYPPFYYKENNVIKGIAVDMVNELFNRMDMKNEIKMYPLKRALGYLKVGKADAIMILIKTPEREQFLNYTHPVLTARGLIWWAADKKEHPIEFKKLEDLKSYKIGVTRGYSYGKKFDNLLKNMDVDYANADINNYRKLLRHRIDAFPGNEIVAKGLFKNNKELQGKFVHSKNSFIEWELHMAISKKSDLPINGNKINKIIDDLKIEGFIDNAVKKYTE